MFFNKNNRPTEADIQRKLLLHKLHVTHSILATRTKSAIVQRGVLDLYPDGVERQRAEADFIKAQNGLLLAIRTADSMRDELINYVKEHRQEFVTTVYWKEPFTSHQVVENTWREFFKQPDY